MVWQPSPLFCCPSFTCLSLACVSFLWRECDLSRLVSVLITGALGEYPIHQVSPSSCLLWCSDNHHSPNLRHPFSVFLAVFHLALSHIGYISIFQYPLYFFFPLTHPASDRFLLLTIGYLLLTYGSRVSGPDGALLYGSCSIDGCWGCWADVQALIGPLGIQWRHTSDAKFRTLYILARTALDVQREVGCLYVGTWKLSLVGSAVCIFYWL